MLPDLALMQPLLMVERRLRKIVTPDKCKTNLYESLQTIYHFQYEATNLPFSTLPSVRLKCLMTGHPRKLPLRHSPRHETG